MDRRLALALAVCTAALGACSLGGLAARPLPRHDGTLIVPGLVAPVTILRDTWGVPHIYAENAHDLFFAQGYTQAQDRWWQMEFFRHVGRGSLSELIGEAGLADDVYFRTLRLHDTAAREIALLEPGAREMLESFVEGVNAYLEGKEPDELAMEYAVLQLAGTEISVEPWSPADSLVFGKIVQMQQGMPMAGESAFQEVIDRVGFARALYWSPPWPHGVKPAILGPGGKRLETGGLFDALLRPPIGSNSWVVGGALSKTGRPILENDPHLGVMTPSFYYEIALHSAGGADEAPIDLAGVAFAPQPGVVIGHNAHIAWGITLGKGVDAWDTYRIAPHPGKPLEAYQWNGGWAAFSVREETFHVAGQDPATFQIRETIHGPVVNDEFASDEAGFSLRPNAKPLALRWAGLEPGGLGNALYRLARASNWDEFRAALAFWDAPPCHFSYADVAGHIGYQLAGKAPVRPADQSGMVPAPGWTEEALWKGYVPYEDLPHAIDPQDGIIVHANQAVAHPDYFARLKAKLAPVFGPDINVCFQPTAYYGYRAERIRQLLEGRAPYDLDAFSRMQADVKWISADEVMPCLVSLRLDDAALRCDRDWLARWDRRFTADSPQATLYALFWKHLTDGIYADEAPPPQPNDAVMYAVRLLLADPANAWWDDQTTPDVAETRDDILARSLRDARDEAVRRFGPLRANWRWGKHHTVRFVNFPLGIGGIGAIAWLVNRGPVGLPGTMETINAAEWVEENDTFAVKWAPAMRMILDVGDWDNGRISLAPGQSGHPASKNYGDQIELWAAVKHRPMLWSFDRVKAETMHTLTLAPPR